MGARGPKRQSPKLVSIKGDPGKRSKSRSKNTPKTTAADPAANRPPAWLCAIGKRYYRNWYNLAAAMRVMTDGDRDHLANIANRQATYRRATKKLREYGGDVYLTTTTAGDVKYSKYPEVEIAQNAYKDVRIGLADFGLTPTGRAGLKADAPQEENPLAAFLKKGR